MRRTRAGDAPGIGALLFQGLSAALMKGEDLHDVRRRCDERAGRYVQASLDQPAAALVLVVEDRRGHTVAWSRARRFPEPAKVLGLDAPHGWYLLGTDVEPAHRRQGLGSWLLRERLLWLGERTDNAYYFTGEDNAASIAMHATFGFQRVPGRRLHVPNAGGPPEGFVLFRASLPM